jgi:putative ABC transport system ATP-binding protein
MSNVIIKVEQVDKFFQVGAQNVQILKNISFEVRIDDFLIIFGPSGCGKSTLLHSILGLEPPTNGKVIFLDKDLYTKRPTGVQYKIICMDEDEKSEFRKTHIGMVYQQPNWIRALNVVENVAFPLQLLGQEKSQAIEKAGEILKTVEMANWAGYVPTELSSGQQQKVALARALITNPEVIIADEPTGNLDYESGQELMRLLTSLNKSHNKTIVMVTHDLEYLNFAKTALKMFNGEIVGFYGINDKRKLITEIKNKGKRGKGIKKPSFRTRSLKRLSISKK